MHEVCADLNHQDEKEEVHFRLLLLRSLCYSGGASSCEVRFDLAGQIAKDVVLYTGHAKL